MQTIGVILLAIGSMLGFGAKRIMLRSWRNQQDESDKEFLQLIDTGSIYIKITGFIIASIGFLFIFL